MYSAIESFINFCDEMFIAEEGIMTGITKRILDLGKKCEKYYPEYDLYRSTSYKPKHVSKSYNRSEIKNDPRVEFFKLRDASERRKENDIYNLGDDYDVNTLTKEDMKLLAPMQSEFKNILKQLKTVVDKYSKSQDLVEIKFHCPADSIGLWISDVDCGVYAFPIGFVPYYNKLTDLTPANKIIDELYSEIEGILNSSKFEWSIDQLKDNTDIPYFVRTRFYYQVTLYKILDPKFKNIFK